MKHRITLTWEEIDKIERSLQNMDGKVSPIFTDTQKEYRELWGKFIRLRERLHPLR